jgi:hypothetical protein
MTDDYYATHFSRQRRPEHKRSEDWARAFLVRGLIAHVATRWDGMPFINPTSYWYDADTNRIYFHSNAAGRVRANIERHPDVCLEVSEFGRFLPSNDPLEATVQYRSVVVFGQVRIVHERNEQLRGLYGLLHKYYPQLEAGRDYLPIDDPRLARTSVYAIEISELSGKENWAEQADQSPDWPPLSQG